MKRLFVLFPIFLILFLNPGISLSEASASSFSVGSATYLLNGVTKVMDIAPYAKDNRTYIPVRYISYALGIDDSNIFWEEASNTVTLLKGDKVVQLKLGSNIILINGAAVTMDVTPEVSNGRTCLPASWVAQAFGESATYNSITQKIDITNQQLTVNNTVNNDTFSYPDGTKYVGETKDGNRSGYGTYFWADGSKYIGSWANDHMEGVGTHTWADGAQYTGSWANDQRSGQGTFTFPNGTKYIGEYSEDKPTGNGTYYDTNGQILGDNTNNTKLPSITANPNDTTWIQKGSGTQVPITANPADTTFIPTHHDEVIESRINGNFEGWTGDTIFKLWNGQIWQQSSYSYTYHYAYSPDVTIYPSGGGYKMHVDGVDNDINVVRLK